MGLHVAQMTSPEQMRSCFDMVTTESAAIMGLDHYGLAVGKRASLIILDAGNPIEAIRLRADRLCVIAKGKVVAQRNKSPMSIALPTRQGPVIRRHAIKH